MQHLYALRLTRIKKANAFDIHEIHLLQIQSYLWPATLNLRFHLIKVLRSKRPAELLKSISWLECLDAASKA